MSEQIPKLSPELAQQLEQLKDIHLPEPISWWPLAWGWWAVLALLVLAVLALIIRHWRGRVYRATIAELETLSRDNTALQSRALSTLLKRVGLHRGRNIESLSGQAWADYLTQNGFSNEQADFIAFASYANPNDYTAPEWQGLQTNAKRWIKQQFNKGSGQ